MFQEFDFEYEIETNSNDVSNLIQEIEENSLIQMKKSQEIETNSILIANKIFEKIENKIKKEIGRKKRKSNQNDEMDCFDCKIRKGKN
ncbi:hypothetical protein M0811_09501 [Anaeramoeba ignava]|uniref:Uncharacterized protein n=1 Tax=Anaeramoeba ignava TaxID=1746090 RepID=A0A9Q0LG70_ANAIG|nr:hypothetical protein M0811_09501 [Anaeramoeba ignava]